MDFHKPKSWHGWREFLKEIVVIVIGVSIALAGEQAVEKWRQHRQYLEASEAMRAELATNIDNQRYRHEASACSARRIAEISALLDKAEKHQLFDPPSWVGEATSGRIRYAAENEAGRSDLFSPAEQRTFANVYSYLHSVDTELDRDRQAWVRLQVLEGRASVPPEMVANLRDALAQARYEDRRVEFLMGFVNTGARSLSLPPPLPHLGSGPEALPLCLPMTTSRDEAIRRTAYRGIQ